MSKEYYYAVKNGFNSGSFKTLDDFLSNKASNVYNGANIIKNLFDEENGSELLDIEALLSA